MIVKAYKTHKITKKDTDILAILDRYLPKIEEGSVVTITSKIIAICEGRIIPLESANKDDLIHQEAEYYLPKETNKYNVSITIKNNVLAAAAGIDESNSDGHFILWPENPQESANRIREYLKGKYKLKNLGILVTDSKTTPLRWGVTGIGLACSGFQAINDMIGTPDLFGREYTMTKVNVMDGLSSAAAMVMGENSEQTPLAIITDVPFVNFQDRNPTRKELEMFHINIEEDVYSTFLKSAPWKKGKGGK